MKINLLLIISCFYPYFVCPLPGRHVDQSTRTCYVVISYIHQLYLQYRDFHRSTSMSTCRPVDQNMLFSNFIYTSTSTCNIEIFIGQPGMSTSRPVDQSMSTGLTSMHFLLHNTSVGKLVYDEQK